MIPANRKGDVYFLKAMMSGGLIKIGWTTKLSMRMQAIQSCCPCDLKILGLIPGQQEQEMTIHSLFANIRLRGEWFQDTKELREYILKWAQEIKEDIYHKQNVEIISKSEEPSNDKRLLLPEEAAYILKVKTSIIYAMCQKEQIPWFSSWGNLRIDRQDLSEFIKNNYA